MKYHLALWTLSLALPSATLPSPSREAGPNIHESLQIGAESYRFHAEKLILSTPNPQLNGKRLFRLNGKLLPASGQPIQLEMTVVEDGRIYLLKLARKRGAGLGEDVWAATLKTRIEVLELQAKAGGRLRLRISGPLAATLKEGGSLTTWSGEIQAVFNGVSE